MSKLSAETLPSEFDFYGMGMVRSVSEQMDFDPTPEGTQAIAYQISAASISENTDPSDLQWMILLVDQDQDLSLVSEIGNILASRATAQWTSPPVFLSPVQLERVTTHIPKAQVKLKKNYRFFSKQGVIPIQLMIVSMFSEDFGNA